MIRKLLDSLQGEAKRTVAGFEFHEANYPLVKRALKERYGDPEIALMEMYRKVKAFNNINDEDVTRFREFVDLVTQLVSYRRRYNALMGQQHFCPIDTLFTIEERLPHVCLAAWQQAKVLYETLHGARIPQEHLLSKLIQFLNNYVEEKRKLSIKNPSESQRKRIGKLEKS